MKLTTRSLYRLLLLALAFLGIIGLGILISGQEAPKQGMPLTDDWSAHHLVFSNPGTAAEALAQGRLEQWKRIVNDPRYIMQQLKRNAAQQALGPAPGFATLAGQLSTPVGDQLSISRNPPPNPKQKLKKDWSMDFGLTSATSTGTVGTLNSSTISVSSTVTVYTKTFDASPPTAATQTGTFSAVPTAYNNPAITITNTSPANVLSLTTNATGAYTTGTFAQAPTSSITPSVTSNSVVTNFKTNASASSATGTFTSASPAANAQITIGSGVNTLTLSNGGTARTVTGTFTAPVLTTTSIGITSNSGTLTMTPGGTAQTAAGTFTNVAASTGNGITITNGTKVLTLNPGGTGQTLAGAFTAVPGLTSNPIVITSNSSTLTMTPGGTAQTAAAAFTAVPARTSPGMTITNGSKVLTLTPGGTAQTAAATFTAVPVTTSNPLVITSNSSTLTMTPGGAAANAVGTFAGTLMTPITVTSGGTVVTTLTPTGVGTATVIQSTGWNHGDIINIGGVIYTADAPGLGYACPAGPCIWWGTTAANAAETLYAAVTNTPSACPTVSDGGGPFTYGCYSNITAANPSVTATYVTGSGVVTLTNTTAGTLTFTTNDTGTTTLSPVSGGITAPATVACHGSGNAYSGSFIGSGTLGTEQTNLLSLLQGCPAGAGFTAATGGTNAVQVSYPAPGSFATLTGAGNVIGIFTWTNTAGNNGSAPTCTGSGTSYTGTFVNSNVADTLATDFYNALNISACLTGVGYSVANPGGSSPTVTLTDLSPGASASIGAFSGANGNGVTWVNNNGTDLGSPTCSGSVNTYTGTFVNSNVAATLATDFYNALTTGTCPANVGYSVPNPSGGTTVTLTDPVLGTAANVGTFTGANGNGVTWTNTNGTAGSATCSGLAPTFTGTFVNSNVAGTLATNFYDALIAGTCPANVGYSVPAPGAATVTLTDLVLGTSAAVGAFSGSGGNGVGWTNPGAGSNLTTPTCTGSSNTWTGTFVNSNVANTLALNFYNALIASSNACATGVGYSVPSPGAATVTLSDLAPGAAATIGATFSGANGNGVGWVNTAGTDGTQNTCSGSSSTYTGTFINNSNTTTLAGNFNTAIGVCAASVGFSASPSTNTVVVTNIASGTGVPLSVTGGASGPFTWNTPSAGSNGTTNGCTNSTTGVFETSTSTATLANNLQLAISSCNTNYPLVGATASYTASNNYFTVNETALGAGSFGASNAPGFSWGTPTIGSNGTGPTCTGTSTPFQANYVVAQTVAGLAQNLVAAINACPTGADIVATYTNGGSFTVANSTFGSGIGTLSSAGGVTSVLTFTATTAGSAGTNTCTGNTTGTYEYSSTLATMAGYLNTAIGDCTAATTGVTSAVSGSGVKLTSYTPGSTGGSGITLGNASGVYSWTASTLSGGTDGTTSGTASPPTFQYWSGNTYMTQPEVATNIATAINENTTTNAVVSAVAGGDVVIVTALAEGTSGNSIAVSSGTFSAFSWNPATDLGGGGLAATVGEGQYPAKFSFSTTVANCASASTPDFVAYNTGVPGSSSQASIIAFFNIYTGCSTTTYPVPAPYWAYNTGGTILTSVVLSNDGTQLAFVHSSAAGSSLVLLHWKAAEGAGAGAGSAAASPATPAATYTSTDVSGWVSCRGGTTSCQLDLPFSGTTANVTRSAPYYDTFNDVLYVGDDQGVLHKFTGVFRGTPGEVTTGGWPITVDSGKILTGPVEDANTYNVFVGDSSGVLSYVLDSGSTTGTCSSSGSSSPPCLGSTTETLTTGPIADGPLVDPSAGTVFAFSGVTSARASYEVLQSNETLSTSSSITFTGVSGYTYTSYMRIGAFDNTYYTNGPSTGHLYVCAPNNNGTSNYNGASLYDIGFNSSGVMNTTTANGPLDMISASPTNGTTVDDCSPLTEFYNGTTDYLFVGVAESGKLTGCTGSATVGCLYNFTINSFPTGSVTGLTETGNTSGIVIDNAVTTPAGEQIYFTNLSSQTCAGNTKPTGNAAGGCAVQASQTAP